MKKIFFISILALLIGISSWFLYLKMSDANTQTKGVLKGFEENSSSISFGLLDSDDNVVDNGSLLEPHDNKLEYTFSLSNFIEVDREYALVVLANFKQIPVKVKGKQYNTYTFNAKSNKTLNFKTSITIDENTSEIDYLIIKKPNYLTEKLNIGKMHTLQEILPLRFKVKNKKPKLNIANFSPDETTNEGPNDTIFISKQKNDLTILPSAKSGEDVFLSIGNIENENKSYNILAFNNWEQVPFIDNQFVGNVSVNPGERKVFPIKLPVVNKKSNFQIIALPQIDEDETSPISFENCIVLGSFRTVITP